MSDILLSNGLIFGCSCDGFQRRHTITFDSQDAEEGGWTKCPCCEKPFLPKSRVKRDEDRLSLTASRKQFARWESDLSLLEDDHGIGSDLRQLLQQLKEVLQ